MLASIFSFRGRVNRLQYFGGLVGLFVSFVVAGVLAFLCLGDLSELQQAPAKVLPVLLIALIVLPVWVWISFSLQARRNPRHRIEPPVRDPGLHRLPGHPPGHGDEHGHRSGRVARVRRIDDGRPSLQLGAAVLARPAAGRAAAEKLGRQRETAEPSSYAGAIVCPDHGPGCREPGGRAASRRRPVRTPRSLSATTASRARGWRRRSPCRPRG